MEKILKVSSYDKFKCKADKCKFTCCEGWDISIDSDTYNKWKSENSEFDVTNDLLEIKLRDTIIKIIQQENIDLDYKLLSGFQMLLELFEKEELDESDVLIKIEEYNDRDHIKETIKFYRKMGLKKTESIEEINYLFLDIIQNYKEISSLKNLLKRVSDFAEHAKIRTLEARWDEYKAYFVKYKQLLENCLISKILSSCVSNDLEEMIIALQMIIIEYLLVRYSLFLKYCMSKNNELNIDDAKDYIMAFSRIIGNNAEAVIEFFKDGFGDEILEFGYLGFITLF